MVYFETQVPEYIFDQTGGFVPELPAHPPCMSLRVQVPVFRSEKGDGVALGPLPTPGKTTSSGNLCFLTCAMEGIVYGAL